MRESTPPALDHVVLNAKTELDGLESEFRGIGFDLSGRGFHSLGSMNHIASLDRSYLELIGVPPENPDVRPEVSRGRTGIDGLVFQTVDADRKHAELKESGFDPSDVQEFSRPVDADDRTLAARFRTVRFQRSPFQAGRVYFCQHLTPELIWGEGSPSHPNRSRCIREVVVVTSDPKSEAERYAVLARRDPVPHQGTYRIGFDGLLLRVVSPESYRNTYRDSALAVEQSPEFFGAVVVGVDAADRLNEVTAGGDWKRRVAGDGQVRLSSNQRRTLICFDQAGGHR